MREGGEGEQRERERERGVWMPTSVVLLPILLPSPNELTADGTPSVSPLPSFSPPTPLSSLLPFNL